MEINDTDGLGPIEGDPNGWHIRMTRRAGDIEAWALWSAVDTDDAPAGRQSSNTIKEFALQWMRDEQDASK